MDPALKELIARGHPDEWVEAIIRQNPQARALPSAAKVMAEFSDIKTVRIRRRNIEAVWADPGTASVKAPRILQFERPVVKNRGSRDLFRPQETASRPLIGNRGRGVVVGVVDWGLDFAHSAFRGTQGGSRVEAIWDQRGEASHRSPRFGYGKVHYNEAINQALESPRPYEALGYHPGTSDIGMGAHGTHVTDIAAGTTRSDGGGLAPESTIAFVHLASAPLSGLANLGDSVRLIEAIAFLDELAGDRPLVINLSVGRHGGPHTGETLVERAFDRFLENKRDRLIVQSAGNYHQSRAHAHGKLLPGSRRTLNWLINERDHTPNELEVWYSNRDDIDVIVKPPGAKTGFKVARGQSRALFDSTGQEIGRLYHRAFDPNSPDHHFEAFLRPSAPSGAWSITLEGKRVEDGRFNAWIERDGSGARQSRFAQEDVSQRSTIGSICNGFLTVSVGAAEQGFFGIRPAPFASEGPTRDGRMKPDIGAPGMHIRAARSAPRWSHKAGSRTTTMSGASQASPFVAGAAAAMLSAQSRPLDIHEIRTKLFRLISPLDNETHATRLGAGVMNPLNLPVLAQSITDRATLRQ